VVGIDAFLEASFCKVKSACGFWVLSAILMVVVGLDVAVLVKICVVVENIVVDGRGVVVVVVVDTGVVVGCCDFLVRKGINNPIRFGLFVVGGGFVGLGVTFCVIAGGFSVAFGGSF
jgi:hypothetical protein